MLTSSCKPLNHWQKKAENVCSVRRVSPKKNKIQNVIIQSRNWRAQRGGFIRRFLCACESGSEQRWRCQLWEGSRSSSATFAIARTKSRSASALIRSSTMFVHASRTRRLGFHFISNYPSIRIHFCVFFTISYFSFLEFWISFIYLFIILIDLIGIRCNSCVFLAGNVRNRKEFWILVYNTRHG